MVGVMDTVGAEEGGEVVHRVVRRGVLEGVLVLLGHEQELDRVGHVPLLLAVRRNHRRTLPQIAHSTA